MSSKFYIYGGGRWREVETDTGCVSGWGRPNFVYMRGGRLVVAHRQRVLRALRSLAAGRPSAAKGSIVLSKYVPSQAPTLQIGTKSRAHQHHETVRSVNNHICAQCNDVRFNRLLKETSCSSVAVQCTATADAANQVSDNMISPSHNNNNTVLPKRRLPLRKNGRLIEMKPNKVNKSIEKSTESVRNKELGAKRLQNTENGNRQESAKSRSHRRQEVKELLIEQEIVEILRRYLRKNDLGVDLNRYDIDAAYKEQVLYKINPLVVVARCPQIKKMVQAGKTKNVSEKHFMSSLGLQTAAQRASAKRNSNQSTSRSSVSTCPAHDNKENESRNVTRTSQRRAKALKDSELNKYKSSKSSSVQNDKKLSPQKMREVVLLSSNSDSDFQEQPLASTLRVSPRLNGLRAAASPARAPSAARGGAGSRVYSPLEDQAIIAWVQRSSRARLVNGNRLWRELQPHHASATGVARSWHSLRNRYLRYILPTLPRLAPSPVAVQLRAAAAAGEIKNRNQKKSGNNSMFALPRVRSAWAPRRARLAAPSAAAPSSRPALRTARSASSTRGSPPRTAKRRARRLSSTSAGSPHRAASSHSSSSGSRWPSPGPAGSSTPTDDHFDRLHEARERSRLSKRYSELRRRFGDVEESPDEAPRVLRPRVSEVGRRSGDIANSSSRVLREGPKKRRLYNPQVI